MHITKDYEGEMNSIVTSDGEVYLSADDMIEFFKQAAEEAHKLSGIMKNEKDRLQASRYKRTLEAYAQSFSDFKAERLKHEWSIYSLDQITGDE